jgi:hypothetical protein
MENRIQKILKTILLSKRLNCSASPLFGARRALRSKEKRQMIEKKEKWSRRRVESSDNGHD